MNLSREPARVKPWPARSRCATRTSPSRLRTIVDAARARLPRAGRRAGRAGPRHGHRTRRPARRRAAWSASSSRPRRSAPAARPCRSCAQRGTVAGLGMEVNVDYLGVLVLDLSGDVLAERVEFDDLRGSDPEAVLAAARADRRRGRRDARRRPGDGLRARAARARRPRHRTAARRAAPGLAGRRRRRAARAARAPRLANEANLAARAEAHARGGGSFVYVSGEVGIGGAIVLDGELFRGRRGWSGEIGHILVDGVPLEELAGQDAMLRNAGIDPTDRLEVLLAALDAGDARALRVRRAGGPGARRRAAAAVNVVDVDEVVLGGTFGRLFDHVRDARAGAARRLGDLRAVGAADRLAGPGRRLPRDDGCGARGLRDRAGRPGAVAPGRAARRLVAREQPLDRYLSRRRRRHPRRSGRGDLARRPGRRRPAGRPPGRRDAVAVLPRAAPERRRPVRRERADGRHGQRVRRRRRRARARGRRSPAAAPTRATCCSTSTAARSSSPTTAAASLAVLPLDATGGFADEVHVLGHVGSRPAPAAAGGSARALRRARARAAGCSWSTWVPTRSGATAARPDGLRDDGIAVTFPPGTGPRHLAFSADGRFVVRGRRARRHRPRAVLGRRLGHRDARCRRFPRPSTTSSGALPSHVLLDGRRLLVGTRTADVVAEFAHDRRRPARRTSRTTPSRGAGPGTSRSSTGGRSSRSRSPSDLAVLAPDGSVRGSLAAALARLRASCAAVTVL